MSDTRWSDHLENKLSTSRVTAYRQDSRTSRISLFGRTAPSTDFSYGSLVDGHPFLPGLGPNAKKTSYSYATTNGHDFRRHIPQLYPLAFTKSQSVTLIPVWPHSASSTGPDADFLGPTHLN